LLGKPEEKIVFERPRQRWKGSIPLNLSSTKECVMFWTGYNWFREGWGNTFQLTPQ
jgi:hypothetical protein